VNNLTDLPASPPTPPTPISIFQIADETEEVTGIFVELIKAHDIKGKKKI
jgi:hypothetical protein